ncbi:MAG: 2-phospho-L-lactate transferase [Actinobacteria bacterium]|nr:MAG: 2-phospho-L-lactate transferase [Actinomycetota bacterium]
MIVVLAGGVGAARFLRGVVRVVDPADVTVIGNTGDDVEMYGVHVSPDLDIVIYTLGGAIDEERGWGLAGDTHRMLEELRALGTDAWFTLGDRDYGVCLARTLAERTGEPLSSITARMADRFGAGIRLLPMTDDPVATRVLVLDEEGHELDLHFQEYWVGRRARDEVVSVRLDGADRARPGPGVLDAIASADAILLAPSNPVVSIGTILSIPGIRDAVRSSATPVVGVSPIVGGAPVRGMADKLMPAAGVDVTASGAASLYRDFLDGWVIDLVDAPLAPAIEAFGVRVEVAQTMMNTVEDAAALAKVALELARSLRNPE